MAALNLARELLNARTGSREADITVAQLPLSEREAYGIAISQCPKVAAWKLGGVNPWSQKVFANKEAFFGPLSAAELFLETREVSIDHLVGPLAEPELAVQIGDWQSSDPRAQIQAIGIGVEVPASVLPAAPKGELLGQITDRAGAGCLWIGCIQDCDDRVLTEQIEIEVAFGGEEPVECSTATLLGGVRSVLASFRRQARDLAMPVQRGQWIATGGLCPARPAHPGLGIAVSGLGSVAGFKFVD